MNINEKGKVSLKEGAINFFKGIFNYLGRSTRRGLCWGLLVAMIIYSQLGIWFEGLIQDTQLTQLCYILLAIITIILMLMFLAAFFRRMRDLGINGRATTVLVILQLIMLFIPGLNLISIFSILVFIGLAIFTPTNQFVRKEAGNGFVNFIFVRK